MAIKRNKFTAKEIAEKGLKKAPQVIINTHYYREKSHQKEFKTVLKWDKEQYKIFVKKIETLEYLIQEFEFIYFAKDPFTKVVDKACLSQLCLEILHELEQTCLMLKKSEDLFINSIIIAKCYKLIKVNQTIFSKIKPYLNIKDN